LWLDIFLTNFSFTEAKYASNNTLDLRERGSSKSSDPQSERISSSSSVSNPEPKSECGGGANK